MKVDRRTFVLGSAAVLASSCAQGAKQEVLGSGRGNPICVSTYSFMRFSEPPFATIDQCIQDAGDMGFDGVEILEKQIINGRIIRHQ